AHVKTTVAAVDIDVDAGTLGYFHGQSFHRLDGADFEAALRVGETDPTRLAPYVEFVKYRDRTPRSRDDTTPRGIALLKQHLTRLPEENPFTRFGLRFSDDLNGLLHDSLERFHYYSFATLRQLGACYELSATYLDWLAGRGEPDLAVAVDAFSELA